MDGIINFKIYRRGDEVPCEYVRSLFLDNLSREFIIEVNAFGITKRYSFARYKSEIIPKIIDSINHMSGFILKKIEGGI